MNWKYNICIFRKKKLNKKDKISLKNYNVISTLLKNI